MDIQLQVTSGIIREIREHSLAEEVTTSNKGQTTAHVHLIPPFRNLVPQEPHGKVLYKDPIVVRQIYDTAAAAAYDTKKLDPHSQLDSFEWKPRDDANFDFLALLLSAAVYNAGSVSDLIYRVEQEIDNKSCAPLIYPAMPVRLRGTIRDEHDVNRYGICLRDGEFNVRIILDREHTLSQDLSFLKERFLFVLGFIESIEKLAVKAGAILL